MTDFTDTPDHHVAMDIQSLTMAASSIHDRGLTDEGLEQLVNSSGYIAGVALAMSLTLKRIKDHANAQ